MNEHTNHTSRHPTAQHWLGRIGRVARRPFSFLTATVSGYFLLTLSWIPLIVLVGLRDWVVDRAYAYLITAAAALANLFIAIPFGRFLLRALPPRADGHRRIVGLVFVLLLGLFYLAICLSILYGNLSLDEFSKDDQQSFLSLLAVRQNVLFALAAWMIGAFGPFIARHLFPKRAIRQPFVLFLRRFSTFADRSVVSAVLKCAPAGKPVAFLTPTASAVRDWNPFQIGLAGLKVWRPFFSMPIDLSASDKDWKTTVKDLISRAEVVVLDATESSAALQDEIAMIRAGGHANKTFLLVRHKQPKQSDEPIDQLIQDGAQVISYKKKWSKAAPRLVAGIFVAFLSGIIPYVLLLLIAINVVSWLGFTISISPRNQQSTAEIQAMLYAYFPVFFWTYYVLFVRAALDNSSVKQMKEQLKN
jgi:hypothetical protein